MASADLDWPPVSRPAKILLTGFGPFPGVGRNLSGDVAEQAGERLRGSISGQGEVHVEIIPTSWEDGPQRIIELHDRIVPDIALHFGVSTIARGFSIEERAANACKLHEADCTGATANSESIVDGGPTVLAATLPSEAIVARLRAAGLPAELSGDAGRYLCNAVLYHALHASRKRANPSSTGFVHIPTELSAPPLTLADAVDGALIIVNTCWRLLPASARA